MALVEYDVSAGKHARALLGADNVMKYRGTLVFSCRLDPDDFVKSAIQNAEMFD
jgi:hypothetical protein